MPSRDGNAWARVLGKEPRDADDRSSGEATVQVGAFGSLEDEKTTVDYAPLPGALAAEPPEEPKLKLPVPGETDAEAKILPTGALPVPDDDGPTLDRAAPLSAPIPAKPRLDDEALLQKLERSPTKQTDDSTIFTKEVILTLVIGLLLLTAAITYNFYSGHQEAQQAAEIERMVAESSKARNEDRQRKFEEEQKAKEAERAALQPTAAQKPAPKKAAVGMLSILSSPSGATVEIDGTIYGKTPLIKPLPNGPQALSIRLMKDNFQKFEAIVKKNEVGHYSLNAKLERSSRR